MDNLARKCTILYLCGCLCEYMPLSPCPPIIPAVTYESISQFQIQQNQTRLEDTEFLQI